MLAVAALAMVSTEAVAQKQAPPAPGTPAALKLPARRTYKLPNGMEVTLAQYGVIPKVAVSLVLDMGDIDQQVNEVWLPEMTADMLLEGTTTRSNADIATQAAGMGGNVVAFAGSDQTTIGGEVLSENAPQMIALVADIARNPKFPESELARIKATRLRTLSIQKSQPQPIAFEKFRSVLYGDHPYGQVFPTEAMINGYTAGQLAKFYQANANASRAHLYVLGRFKEAEAEKAIAAAFGTWARGKPAVRKPVTPKATRSVSVIDRPKAVQSTVLIGLPVADPSSADYTRMTVTNSLLGGSFGSRITRNIREDKGYTYSPFSQVSSRYRTAYWAEQADVTTAVTGPSVSEILKEVDRLRAEKPTATELQGIKNYSIGTFILGMNSRQGLINGLQFKDLHGLPDTYLTGMTSRITAITPEDVQRTAQTYLDPSRMTLVVVGDRSEIDEQLRPWTGATP